MENKNSLVGRPDIFDDFDESTLEEISYMKALKKIAEHDNSGALLKRHINC
jgi:hypothetical protein